MTKIAGYPFTSYKIKFVLCINDRVHCAELSLYVCLALLGCKLYICNLLQAYTAQICIYRKNVVICVLSGLCTLYVSTLRAGVSSECFKNIRAANIFFLRSRLDLSQELGLSKLGRPNYIARRARTRFGWILDSYPAGYIDNRTQCLKTAKCLFYLTKHMHVHGFVKIFLMLLAFL